MPAPFLGGKLVFLRPVERGDFGIIAKWINDPAVTYYMFYGQLPTNLEQVERLIEEQISLSKNVVFMVCGRKTGKPIGFAGLYDIHLTARKAEFRILIGERRFWGRGYGTEVTELLTFYGFDRLNLHRIYLGVTDANKGAVRAYEKAGFIREGVLRDDIYRNSCYCDSVRMAILRDDYYRRFYKKHARRFS